MFDESSIIDGRIPLTYKERVRWFFNNYYETGMEYLILLDSLKDDDLDNFEWYDDIINIPKYREDLSKRQLDAIDSNVFNVGVYRSPKWLRNIVDFEVNTGRDIKGEPSKREKERLEKEKSRKEKEAAEAKAKKVMDEAYARARKAREDAERKEEQEQERISKDLDDLYDNILEDFKSARYHDKMSTPTNSRGDVYVIYNFENGYRVKMEGDRLEYGNVTYTLGAVSRVRFVRLFNAITEAEKTYRPGGSKTWGSSNSNTGSGSKNTGSSSYKSEPKSSDPKRNLYDSLVSTIKQRESQLAKMSKTDPDRKALENELNVAKTKRDSMKIKYKFESLSKLISFNLFKG